MIINNVAIEIKFLFQVLLLKLLTVNSPSPTVRLSVRLMISAR